jgi:hypothetical protein
MSELILIEIRPDKYRLGKGAKRVIGKRKTNRPAKLNESGPKVA